MWVSHFIVANLALAVGAAVTGDASGILAPPSRRLQSSSSNQAATINGVDPVFNCQTTSSYTTTQEDDPMLPKTYCRTTGGGVNTTTDASTYKSVKGFSFRRYCNADFVGADLIGTTAPSWDLCMETCASFLMFNSNLKANVTCAGVVFIPGWTDPKLAVGNTSYPGNCFLKNQMPRVNPSTGALEVVASKLL